MTQNNKLPDQAPMDPGDRLRRILEGQNASGDDPPNLELPEGVEMPSSPDLAGEDLNVPGDIGEAPGDDTPLSEKLTLPPASWLPETRESLDGDLSLTDDTPPLTIPQEMNTPTNVLPRRVEEVDRNATRVIPVQRVITPVTQPSATNQHGIRPPAGSPPTRTTPGRRPPSRRSVQPKKHGLSAGCLVKGIIGLLFGLVVMVIAAGSIMVFEYYRIAASLPDIDNLQAHASQFETTRILDRDGNVLYEILDPNAGRRTYVPLEKISPFLVAATIATEDQEYYSHPGYDPIAIARAFIQNYTNQEIVSGASTITQQLARNLLFSPEERVEETLGRKSREIVLAAEITRRYSKDEILELYLNENFYGSLAYGVEAAAETYFKTDASNLNLAQAAFLAGLPQSPSVYDIHTNRDATLARNRNVLRLILQMSSEKDCIYVSNNPQRICVSEDDVVAAVTEIEGYVFPELSVNMHFPHWVNYIQTLLEQQYDSQTIYRSGFTIHTTLNPELQKQAEKIVKAQVDALADRNVQDGAVVVIKPATGEILAMVGSADFYSEAISGQVNMAISPRQPGSAIKPLTYVAAFEKGWTPATLIWDVPTDFPPSGNPDDQSPPYQPVNYDGEFHGPATVRSALANSYNIPAVKALLHVGIYDNPQTDAKDGLIEFAKRLGIKSLTREDYGMALALGGGEVSLLELTRAYSAFANNGVLVPGVAITRVTDYQGNVIFEHKPESGFQAVRAEHAYLISSILADREARIPMFGYDPVINLSFTAAVKTGTTNENRDNWTIGYTPDLVVGVWVGNADYTPMSGTTGLTGAAPIWAQVMETGIQQLTGGNPSSFSIPVGIIQRNICTLSGTEPSEWCPATRLEFFAADQLPLPKEQDLWQKIEIDTWTGLKANEVCEGFTEEKQTVNVTESAARKWIKQTDAGKQWAKSMGFPRPIVFTPSEVCTAEPTRPVLKFSGLIDGQTITTGDLEIVVQAYAGEKFKNVSLQYGVGKKPAEWITLVAPLNDPIKSPDTIYTWDLTAIEPGIVTLRLYMQNKDGGFAELKIQLNIQVPTPTPTLTPTLMPTDAPSPTDTPSPTDIPPPLPVDTDTPVPTDTPLPLPTEVPSETPTMTPTL
ncbi:MAG: hypothetical protein C0391_07575 [Anaerolinea sp.]|nr:hypothetical protein [Anaerolinea sp.]